MNNKKLKTYAFSMLIIALILFFILSIYSIAIDQNVVVSIVPRPKIDIVLAKSKTSTDLTNFESNMLTALQNQNIDTNDVKISAVEAEQVDFTDSFAWEKDIASYIGNISIVNNGKDVTMIGNYSNPGKNALWIMPTNENEDQKFSFDYSISFGDSFNAAGMLLKIKRDGNTLTGYMLSFNNSSWKSASGGYNGAIWEFTYIIGQNSTNMYKVLKQGLNINTWGSLTVTTSDSEITVEGGGLSSKVVYKIEKDFGSGYGFFSDHYSHGCSDYGSFSLKNINLQTTSTKRFDEVLRQPEWRNGSYKFLVNVTDSQNKELNSSSTYGELVTRLMNDNIYFISWGQAINQLQFTNLINQNDGKGIFINNSNYYQSINQTAIYIKSLLDQLESSEYVIVNEPVSITVNPEEAKYNTADSNWPYGKWKIIHDYEFYENNIGQFADSGKYVSDFISTFDKTGRYEITYENKSITPKYIYVHRKPVASFIMRLSNGIVELNSNSYDLDQISENNGISEEEWKWKTSDQTEWNTGKLVNYDSNKTYLIQLRVKDLQNTWSNPTTKFIYNGSDTLPVAMFNIKEDTFTKYELLNLEDQSYDPSGKTIIKYSWEIYNDAGLVYSGETIPTDFTNYALGNYTISLAVTNSNNSVSERVSRTFTIIDDTLAPEVVVTPVESNWLTSITLNLSFIDKGGSNFKNYKYAITNSQDTPTTWSNAIAEINSNITINSEGLNYLHIISEDNAGNISKDRITGPYRIDKTGPNISVNIDLNTVTINPLDLIATVTDNLSGLNTLTINNQTYETDTSYKIYKNGTYTILATDNLGNSSTTDVIVTNINRTCNEGLEHPDYSSSYDECPICKLLRNVQITNTNFVYDNLEHRVEYDNPDNVVLNEYYNGTTYIPIKSGLYNYTLKVIYNGAEYNTHFVDTMTIFRKDISITNIVADNRQYDGTNFVKLCGGELKGVESEDVGKVNFVLPEIGTVENKNIGIYFVTIPKIDLTGDECYNYSLIQPDIKDVIVQITQKDITIENIKANDKLYNKNNIVDIDSSSGNLVGILKDEDVSFILPSTGLAEKKDVGSWNVSIDKIVLNGSDMNNYNLVQPKLEDITVNILDPLSPSLFLETSVQEINGEKYVPLSNEFVRVSNNDNIKLLINVKNTGLGAGYAKEVKIKLPKEVMFIENDELNNNYKWLKEGENIISTNILGFENGEENEISLNNNLKLELNLKIKGLFKEYTTLPLELGVIQTSINNTLIPDTTNVSNTIFTLKSNYTNMVIKQFISSINNTDTNEKISATINDGIIDINKTNSLFEVEQKDLIKYTIRVYNQGEIDAFASKIINYADTGLEFVPDDEINQKYKWKMLDKNNKETKDASEAVKFITDYLEKTKINSFNGKEVDFQDIQILFKIKDFREKGKILNNSSEIFECKDVRNIVIDNVCSESEKIDEAKLTIKFFDFSLKQIPSSCRVFENGYQILDLSNKNIDSILKVELNRKKLDNFVVKFTFDIYITNEGEISGYVKELKDYIPNGLKFLEEDNPYWNKSNSNIITTSQLSKTLIKPGETKKLQLILTWDNSSKKFGNFKNIIEISKDDNLSKTPDVDSLPDNKKEDEDDISIKSVIVLISTGIFISIASFCVYTLLLIFGISLIYIIIKTIRFKN